MEMLEKPIEKNPALPKVIYSIPVQLKKDSDIITKQGIENAKIAANKLLEDFKLSKTRIQKLRIMRIAGMEANKAKGKSNRRLRNPTYRRFKEIAQIYVRIKNEMRRLYLASTPIR